MIFFIKLYYRDKSKLGNVSIPFDFEDNEFSQLIIKVTKIFEDWPSNYYKFLDEYKRIQKSKPKYDRGSYINNYGYFFIDLYNKYNHPKMNFLRDEYENYIYNNWDNSLISNSKSFRKDVNSAKYLSVTQVAKILKCKHVYVRNLITNGYLKAKATKERKEFLLISRESVNEYISNKDFYANRTDVCSILNISYKTVIDLEKNFLAVRSSPIIEGSNEVLYDRRKIDQILRIIENRYIRHKIKSKRCRYKLEELTDITKSIKYSVGTNITDMISLVIMGKILVVDKNDTEVGLRQYLLRKSEIWEQSLENKIKKRGERVLSKPDLSYYLDISTNPLNAIINHGFLKPTEQMAKPYFQVEDAIEFKNKYVNLSQLSKVVSIDIDSLLEIIKNQNKNILPVLDHFQKKYKLYKIHDVMFLLDKI